jgi:hypothetical protein
MQAWYAKHFAAGKRGRNQAADVPGANLTFTKSDKPTIPTRAATRSHRVSRREGPRRLAKKLEAGGCSAKRQIVRALTVQAGVHQRSVRLTSSTSGRSRLSLLRYPGDYEEMIRV